MEVEFLEHFSPTSVKELQSLANGYQQGLLFQSLEQNVV